MWGLQFAYHPRRFSSQEGSRFRIQTTISSRRRALLKPPPIYAMPQGRRTRLHSENPWDRFSQKKNDSRFTTRFIDTSSYGISCTSPRIGITLRSSRYFFTLIRQSCTSTRRCPAQIWLDPRGRRARWQGYPARCPHPGTGRYQHHSFSGSGRR